MYIHTYMDVSVAEWLAWLTSNCGPTCEAKKDLIPCASAFTSMYVWSTPTYKQYIDVVIHQYIHTYIHTYIYTLLPKLLLQKPLVTNIHKVVYLKLLLFFKNTPKTTTKQTNTTTKKQKTKQKPQTNKYIPYNVNMIYSTLQTCITLINGVIFKNWFY